DVEQIAARANRRFDSDKSTQCADERRRRNKEGKRGVDAAAHAKNKMPEFVRGQNAKQGGGERNAQQQSPPVRNRPAPGPVIRVTRKRGQVVSEIKLQPCSNTQR